MIKYEMKCINCGWEGEVELSEIPLVCPDCEEMKVKRRGEWQSLEDMETKSDKI